LADVLHVDPLAGVIRQAALEKTALGRRHLLVLAVGPVRYPVAVHDDESVSIGETLEAGLGGVESDRFGAGCVAGKNEHDGRGLARRLAGA